MYDWLYTGKKRRRVGQAWSSRKDLKELFELKLSGVKNATNAAA